MNNKDAYDHVKNLVGESVDELVRQWETEGIIYEGQWGLSSYVMKYEYKAVLRLIQDAGYEFSEHGAGPLMEMLDVDGPKFAIFDYSRYTPQKAKEKIRKNHVPGAT